MIQPDPIASRKGAVACRVGAHLRILFFAILLATSGSFFAVDVRSQGQVQSGAASPATKKKHKLRITKGYITAVSLEADKAKMSDIAVDLSKRLGPQVILGTEDTGEQPEAQIVDDPLQVDLEDNYLTIRSKKQLLVAVVVTIAEVLEVPAEIKYDSNEIVDTVIKDTPFEDAITRLSPNIRLYVRADLTRSQRTPLRLRLVAPAKVADSAMNQ